MRISFSSSFKKAFKNKISNNIRLEEKLWNRIEIFQNDPYDPVLKTHKLSGKLKDLWSFRIDYDIRVIFIFSENNEALFIDIGTHREVY
ncbi:MAG: type II toxin-antitoxin system YafQ family toxin [Ignavibacteria bacterium]